MIRPLDSLRSFKVKTGLVVVIALFAASGTFWLAAQQPFRYALLLALVVALVVTQIVAHGMTSPLREMTAASRAMANGDYTHRVRATSRDEIGQLAVAFNTMSADLAEADRYRRELIGNVSHELRTPIASLQAVLENIADGVQEATPRAVGVALEQTERLARLVDDLLDLSKLEGGALGLSRSRFDLREFLTSVVTQSTATRFSVSVEPSGATVTADEERVRQVVANLIENAVRHGPPDGAVAVSAVVGDDTVRIDVVDEGDGIAPADRARVFDRFVRGGSTDGGTGIGLAIARWAAELHGGTLDVVDVGAGCCFRLTLPV
ncbi:HAMP domain-containing sensor histidine kinase [Rhodococcus sp. SORGH_AS_0301]|uniref:HAMP domain-containing sensor histidine kinase n=1 Tax=Rhodococcus sp. SORGH_AS_0301 TaxID=3041780 RepID=UPI002789D67A|nr:HAMP domain-containing sensor histidine kinase [Rhodococcus sp. SORGH_AS_0301]MDQ1181464.1 signal transduction histidine kinase [Rhodococcus sp. SORGH_AS_0301]